MSDGEEVYQFKRRMDVRNSSILAASQGLRCETKIEYLTRRDFFGQAHALLGELDGAAHPRVIEIAQSAETAELEIVNFGCQGTVLDAEILGNDLDGFAAMLREVLLPLQAGADKA